MASAYDLGVRIVEMLDAEAEADGRGDVQTANGARWQANKARDALAATPALDADDRLAHVETARLIARELFTDVLKLGEPRLARKALQLIALISRIDGEDDDEQPRRRRTDRRQERLESHGGA